MEQYCSSSKCETINSSYLTQWSPSTQMSVGFPVIESNIWCSNTKFPMIHNSCGSTSLDEASQEQRQIMKSQTVTTNRCPHRLVWHCGHACACECGALLCAEEHSRGATEARSALSLGDNRIVSPRPSNPKCLQAILARRDILKQSSAKANSRSNPLGPGPTSGSALEASTLKPRGLTGNRKEWSPQGSFPGLVNDLWVLRRGYARHWLCPFGRMGEQAALGVRT